MPTKVKSLKCLTKTDIFNLFPTEWRPQATPVVIAGTEWPRERQQPSRHPSSHPAEVGSSQLDPEWKRPCKSSSHPSETDSSQPDSERRPCKPSSLPTKVSSSQLDPKRRPGQSSSSSSPSPQRPRKSSSRRRRQRSSFARKLSSAATVEMLSAEIAPDSASNKVAGWEGERKETKEKVRLAFETVFRF